MERKSDADVLNEAYDKIVEEGFGDVMRARGAHALGAVKGLGDRAKGALHQGAAKGLNTLQKGLDKTASAAGYDRFGKSALEKKGAELEKSGRKLQSQGARAGEEARYKSYLTSSVKGIVRDLQKLGMDVDDAVTLEQELRDTIMRHLKQVTDSGQYKTAKGGFGSKLF